MDNQDYMIGGAFMGNDVQKDDGGNVVLVEAYQHIDPNVLGKADGYGKRGKMITHEITEAYYGAEIALKNGVGCGDSRNPNSYYLMAHKKATEQKTIIRRYLDSNLKIMKSNPRNGDIVRGEVFLFSYPNGVEEEFHSIPYKEPKQFIP